MSWPILWPISHGDRNIAVRHLIAAKLRDGATAAEWQQVVNDAECQVRSRVADLTHYQEIAEYAMTGVMPLNGKLAR